MERSEETNLQLLRLSGGSQEGSNYVRMLTTVVGLKLTHK